MKRIPPVYITEPDAWKPSRTKRMSACINLKKQITLPELFIFNGSLADFKDDHPVSREGDSRQESMQNEFLWVMSLDTCKNKITSLRNNPCLRIGSSICRTQHRLEGECKWDHEYSCIQAKLSFCFLELHTTIRVCWLQSNVPLFIPPTLPPQSSLKILMSFQMSCQLFVETWFSSTTDSLSLSLRQSCLKETTSCRKALHHI